MLRIARYWIAAASITLTLGGCQDPAAPPGIKPIMSSGQPTMSSVAGPAATRLPGVFDGDQAPPDFTERGSALGGVVDMILAGVGLAAPRGLTDPAAREPRSGPGA